MGTRNEHIVRLRGVVVSKLKITSVKYNTKLTHSVIEDLYGRMRARPVFEHGLQREIAGSPGATGH